MVQSPSLSITWLNADDTDDLLEVTSCRSDVLVMISHSHSLKVRYKELVYRVKPIANPFFFVFVIDLDTNSSARHVPIHRHIHLPTFSL